MVVGTTMVGVAGMVGMVDADSSPHWVNPLNQVPVEKSTH
jgi:hypothetical protein